MAKWAAAEEVEDVNDKIKVNALLSLELQLLQMEFEFVLREKYNDEQEIMYGLKDEKRVLQLMQTSIQGMFKDFACRKNITKQEKYAMLNAESV